MNKQLNYVLFLGVESTGRVAFGHEIRRVSLASDVGAHTARGAAPADVGAFHTLASGGHRRQPRACRLVADWNFCL